MVYSTLITTYASFFITDEFIFPAQRNYEFHSNIIIIIQLRAAVRMVKRQLQILLGSFPANGQDITLIEKPNKEGAFIDIEIPLVHSIQNTITGNQRKYQDLAF